MEKLILLKRTNPESFEIHNGKIEQGKNLLLTTKDGKLAEGIVNSFNNVAYYGIDPDKLMGLINTVLEGRSIVSHLIGDNLLKGQHKNRAVEFLKLTDGASQMKTDIEMTFYFEGEKKHHENVARVNARILKAIGNQLGKEFLQDLEQCLEELSEDCIWQLTHHYELTSSSKGEWSENIYDNEKIKGYYVDQYVNGGMTGDNFEGYIYIPLTANKYLKVWYSM